MKIRSFDPERAGVVLLVAVSAVVAVTCAGRGTIGTSSSPAPPLPASTAAQGSTSPTSIGAPPTAPLASVAAPPASPVAGSPKARGLELPRLFAALGELEHRRRTSHVRVAWFGDSHSAADFLPHAVRQALGKRFGHGGPGYVLIGVKAHRHSAAKVDLVGGWRFEPDAPAGSLRSGDGVFGLNGMRAIPEAWDARASVTPHPAALRGRARFELLYRLPQGASFRVSVGGEAPVEVNGKTVATATPGSPIRRFLRESGPTAKLEVTAGYQAPQLFGVVVEGSEPGVVIDTLGINGARTATPLAWDEPFLVAELRARRPDVLVLAYGTNEAFETRSTERYGEHLERLVERLRQGAPQAECLVLGPPDTPGADGASLSRVIEIEAVQRLAAGELGCAFFSQLEAMGGQASFARWMKETPPLAAPDRIHLTSRGYERIGEAIARVLIEGYDTRRARASE